MSDRDIRANGFISADSVRAFLAIPLQPSVLEKVAQLKRGLARTGAAVRWARDEGLHLTLKFLGTVTPERVEAVRQALAPRCAEIGPFWARVAGVGVFPRPQRPRILWVGVRASELAHLSRVVEEAAAEVGFAAETRPFRAHVTLGRIKDRHGWPALAKALEENRELDFGDFEVRHVTAFRSDLQRGGSVYSEIWTIPLENLKRQSCHC